MIQFELKDTHAVTTVRRLTRTNSTRFSNGLTSRASQRV